MDGFDQTLLAFDTSLNGCVVACVTAGGKPATRALETDRDQAAKLIPLIQDCMAEAGVVFHDVEKIITTVGPGSFTGLRIGLSTAQTLALALSKPLVGLTTLDVAAQQALRVASGAPFLVLIETKRSDYYGQLFDGQGAAQSEPAALSGDDFLQQLDEHVVFGDAAARFMQETGYQGAFFEMGLLDPLDLLALGAKAAATHDIAPLYLRGADVSSPKNKLPTAPDIESLFK